MSRGTGTDVVKSTAAWSVIPPGYAPLGRLGLVLSGGGAKGAYQAGVFRALADLDLMSQVAAVSGSSIGALNAVLFAMEDKALWDQVWGQVSYGRFLARDEDAPKRKLMDLIRELRDGEPVRNLGELIARSQLSPFSQTGIRQVLEEFIDFEKVRRFRAPLYACAYDMEAMEPAYFRLNGRTREEIITLTLASSAIPVVFPPVEFEGKTYCDGGIVPPYAPRDNSDKIPLRPLEKESCDYILIVYLSHDDRVDTSRFPGKAQFIHLYPSRPLELVKGAGTLDLTRDSIVSHMIQGYNDAAGALGPLLMGLLRGRAPQELILRHEEENQRFLEHGAAPAEAEKPGRRSTP